MRKLLALLFVIAPLALSPQAVAAADQLCQLVSGAKIVAQDDENTFLGTITGRYDSDSIFNQYGDHGSKYSDKSIWNEYADFGSKYSDKSPFNKFTSTPPLIIKGGEVIGFLSSNKNLKNSISPNLLKALCEDAL